MEIIDSERRKGYRTSINLNVEIDDDYINKVRTGLAFILKDYANEIIFDETAIGNKLRYMINQLFIMNRIGFIYYKKDLYKVMWKDNNIYSLKRKTTDYSIHNSHYYQYHLSIGNFKDLYKEDIILPIFETTTVKILEKNKEH